MVEHVQGPYADGGGGAVRLFAGGREFPNNPNWKWWKSSTIIFNL